MHKVLVVDDEPLVRLAVKSLINWEAHGFTLELEASNGKQALKILEENPDIDIIITDINMPVMDGLTLISEVPKRGFSPEMIVLSAYNDYAWVREAFKLGVNDYLLKTEMDPEGILNILNGMVSKINEKKNKPVNGQPFFTGQDLRYQRDVILKSIIEQQDVKDIESKAINAGLRLSGRNSCLCYLWVDDYQTVLQRYNTNTLRHFTQSVYNSIYQVLSETNTGEALCLSPQEYILFFSFENNSRNLIREKILDILGRVKHSLKNYVNINVTIGVSSIQSGFNAYKQLFEQSAKNARLRFILGKGKVIFPEEADTIKGHGIEGLIGKEAGFVKALREGELDKVMAELDKLTETIKNKESCKIEKIYSNYMELIFIIISFLNENGREAEEIFGKEIDFYEKILRFETQEEINIWIRNIITWVVNSVKENTGMKTSRAISSAKEFIRNNYSNSNLSLRQVSEYVQLSESHFSSTFTKETGTTFIDYLTKIRIDKAKELISKTNLKIYEICDKSGYTNTEHFSRIFKKVVGVSPKEYKNSYYQIKNQ